MDNIGKVPPSSIEAEMSMLGAMILDKDAIYSAAEIIKAEDFYLSSHQSIFNAIMELNSRGEPVDLVTVSSSLKRDDMLEKIGGMGYLSELTDKGILTTNAHHYAKIIEEKSTLRRLIKASSEIIEKGYNSEDAVDLLEMAEKSIFDISQKKSRDKMVEIKDVLLSACDRIERMHGSGEAITGVTTGFVDLDRKTSGLQKSDLILVAARPSMGKTAFSLNICQSAGLKGYSVAVFSLEMSKEQLVDRMLASESHIPIGKIRTGDLVESEWLLLTKAMGKLSEARIFIDDTPGITVNEVRAKCRKLKIEKGLDLIMIDYLQLMNGSGKSESRQQEISTISRSLKAIAREMNCPVIALSQLSRAPELRADHRPMLSDLRESGAIEQDADIVMFLYRDEYYFKDSERPGIGEVIIAKQRNGETGTVDLAWIGQFTKFGDLARNTDLSRPRG